MDKVFSARLDESIIQQISLLSRKLYTTKKTVMQTGGRIYTLNTKHIPMPKINTQRGWV